MKWLDDNPYYAYAYYDNVVDGSTIHHWQVWSGQVQDIMIVGLKITREGVF